MKPRIYPMPMGGAWRFWMWTPLGTDISGMTCIGSIKPLEAGMEEPSASATKVLDWSVSAFAGDALRGPGFALSVSPTQTRALPKARYFADAIITVSGEPYFTRSWIIDGYIPASEVSA